MNEKTLEFLVFVGVSLVIYLPYHYLINGGSGPAWRFEKPAGWIMFAALFADVYIILGNQFDGMSHMTQFTLIGVIGGIALSVGEKPHKFHTPSLPNRLLRLTGSVATVLFVSELVKIPFLKYLVVPLVIYIEAGWILRKMNEIAIYNSLRSSGTAQSFLAFADAEARKHFTDKQWADLEADRKRWEIQRKIKRLALLYLEILVSIAYGLLVIYLSFKLF